MKKKIIIPIIIVLCMCVIFIIYLKNTNKVSEPEVDIQGKKYIKLSNNLYYEDELIEEKWKEDKETILKYYRTISDYLNTKYPFREFYIFNFHILEEDNGIKVNLMQIMDMVIIDGTTFSLNIKNGKVEDYWDMKYEEFVPMGLDTTINVSADEAIEKALNLAKDNYDKMSINGGKVRKITGGKVRKSTSEWYLGYDKQENFYYYIRLNLSSFVKINAVTGEIMEYGFHNGIIF